MELNRDVIILFLPPWAVLPHVENERRGLMSSIIITRAFSPVLLCAFTSICFLASLQNSSLHLFHSVLQESYGSTLKTLQGPSAAAVKTKKNAEQTLTGRFTDAVKVSEGTSGNCPSTVNKTCFPLTFSLIWTRRHFWVQSLAPPESILSSPLHCSFMIDPFYQVTPESIPAAVGREARHLLIRIGSPVLTKILKLVFWSEIQQLWKV